MNTIKLESDSLLSPTVHMSLLQQPISEAAKHAVHALANRISVRSPGKKPLPNHLMTLAATIADLLKGAACQPRRFCFRPMGAGEFTGMDVGYYPFKMILERLAAASMVQIEPGFLDPVTFKGRVTRISATETLLSELASFGITPADWQSHFAQRAGSPLMTTPIQRRAKSTRNRKFDKLRGKRLPVDWNDATVAAIAAEVTNINEFLAKQTYEGMAFDGLFRGFNNGNDPTSIGTREAGCMRLVAATNP
jgi:hypothetical protein